MSAKTKTIDPYKTKDRIILSVLNLIELSDPKFKEEALECLNDFSKYYSVPLKGLSTNSDLMERLKEFILNIDGYNKTIPNLYRSLI